MRARPLAPIWVPSAIVVGGRFSPAHLPRPPAAPTPDRAIPRLPEPPPPSFFRARRRFTRRVRGAGSVPPRARDASRALGQEEPRDGGARGGRGDSRQFRLPRPPRGPGGARGGARGQALPVAAPRARALVVPHHPAPRPRRRRGDLRQDGASRGGVARRERDGRRSRRRERCRLPVPRHDPPRDAGVADALLALLGGEDDPSSPIATAPVAACGLAGETPFARARTPRRPSAASRRARRRRARGRPSRRGGAPRSASREERRRGPPERTRAPRRDGRVPPRGVRGRRAREAAGAVRAFARRVDDDAYRGGGGGDGRPARREADAAVPRGDARARFSASRDRARFGSRGRVRGGFRGGGDAGAPRGRGSPRTRRRVRRPRVARRARVADDARALFDAILGDVSDAKRRPKEALGRAGLFDAAAALAGVAEATEEAAAEAGRRRGGGEG